MRRRIVRGLALAVPLILVNSAAIWGQAGWAHTHITPADWQPLARIGLSVLFALAVESVGIYLAWEAHAALLADQASGLLRAGSYGVGCLVGALNYAHFAGTSYLPTAQAIAFGVLSAISPWLWAIRSRSMNRDRLAELDLVDQRGVRLSTSRKLWHPWRSLAVMSWAAWAGVTAPAAAVAGWEASRRGHRADTTTATTEVSAEASEAAGQEITVPADQPGGTIPAVAYATDEARLMARALKAYRGDMTPDMIAPLVGRSARTVERYLNGSTAREVTPA